MQPMQNNAVQERIKRMMKEKKMAKQNQSQSQIRKRVLSQNCFQDKDTSVLLRKQNEEQDEKSIRTEWRKRNTEANKYRQTENSQTTTNETSGQNSRIQVQKIVSTVFSHSPKLAQYLEQYRMNKQTAMNELMASELFVLSLSSKLSKMANDGSMNSIVENEIILKLTKISKKKKQSLSCYDIQNRITNLINKRLDILKKY